MGGANLDVAGTQALIFEIKWERCFARRIVHGHSVKRISWYSPGLNKLNILNVSIPTVSFSFFCFIHTISITFQCILKPRVELTRFNVTQTELIPTVIMLSLR